MRERQEIENKNEDGLINAYDSIISTKDDTIILKSEHLILKAAHQKKIYTLQKKIIEKILQSERITFYKIGELLNYFCVCLLRLGEIERSNEITLKYISYLVQRKYALGLEEILDKEISAFLSATQKHSYHLISSLLRNDFAKASFYIGTIKDTLDKNERKYIFNIVSEHISEWDNFPQLCLLRIDIMLNASSFNKKLFLKFMIRSILVRPYYFPFYLRLLSFYLSEAEKNKAEAIFNIMRKFDNDDKFEEKSWGEKGLKYYQGLFANARNDDSIKLKQTHFISKKETTEIFTAIHLYKDLARTSNNIEEEKEISRDVKLLLSIGKKKSAEKISKEINKKRTKSHNVSYDFHLNLEGRIGSIEENLYENIDESERRMLQLVKSYNAVELQERYKDLCIMFQNFNFFKASELVLSKIEVFFENETNKKKVFEYYYMKVKNFIQLQKLDEAMALINYLYSTKQITESDVDVFKKLEDEIIFLRD